ncbi:MAG: protein-glutamate O-methyltransferase family protein [Nostocales cyanobacterium]|nr:MAG: protein-glutamate O-methyltransferase family protein [Nostocales cyanobacterium]TAF20372.1 MAG: protein-glutamate O-methyltransferase family protein [Nostocales cyanobacterium]
MPDIARRVIKENNFDQEINQSLEQLATDLKTGYLQPLKPDHGIDIENWHQYIKPYLNQRWIDIPWFVAETYFYRLILNITNYFIPGKYQNLDPFISQKEQGLEIAIDAIIYLCTQVEKWLKESQQQSKPNKSSLIALLYFSLWGNRVDLSLWSAFADNRSNFDIEKRLSNILVDDSFAVTKLLTKSDNNRIDIIVDNAGFELICDLCLVNFLLDSGFANQVILHLKPHPTFVSDAMIKDVQYTQEFLAAGSHPDVKSFSKRLSENLETGKLLLKEDYFWTSPLPFWQLPPSLHDELAKSNLIIVKGDANYRRLLGDLHWDYTTKLADIVTYLPAPMVALRTLKSEVAAGLKAETLTELATLDPNWLTNGEWGVIQLVNNK